MEPDAKVSFHAHPCLTRLVQAWGGTKRWKPSRKLYKRIIREPRRQKGLQEHQARAAKWEEEAHGIGRAAMSVDWSDIHRLNPGSHMELQTAYRIKAVAFNRWNGELDPTTCIHAGCTATAPTSPSHWFWQCSAARRAWSLFLAPWERLHGRPWGELQQSVFRFSLDRLPVHAVELLVPATLPTRDRHAQLDVVLEVVQHAWTGTILSVLHGLWVWRTGILFEPLITTQQQWVKLVTRTQSRIRALSYSLRIDQDPLLARAAREVLEHLTGMYQSTQLTRMVPVQGQATQYICFFDGGSRGNPGPGGAGSVIVKVNRSTRAAHIIFCACMSYGARTTTNNVAEYWGLVHGLRYAIDHKLRSLHVVGDSTLILTQVETHRPPKAAHLQPLYLQARRLASDHGVTSWRHHLRAFNKMADAAANVAMEDKASIQCSAPELRTDVDHIHNFRTGDVTHWFNRTDSS